MVLTSSGGRLRSRGVFPTLGKSALLRSAGEPSLVPCAKWPWSGLGSRLALCMAPAVCAMTWHAWLKAQALCGAGRLRTDIQQNWHARLVHSVALSFFLASAGRLRRRIRWSRPVGGASNAAEGRAAPVDRASPGRRCRSGRSRIVPTGRSTDEWCSQCGQARVEPIGRAPYRRRVRCGRRPQKDILVGRATTAWRN